MDLFQDISLSFFFSFILPLFSFRLFTHMHLSFFFRSQNKIMISLCKSWFFFDFIVVQRNHNFIMQQILLHKEIKILLYSVHYVTQKNHDFIVLHSYCTMEYKILILLCNKIYCTMQWWFYYVVQNLTQQNHSSVVLCIFLK